MMSCDHGRSLLDAYTDGELPSTQMLELQAHIDSCAECAEAALFSRAMRLSIQRVAQDDAVVTEDFRLRLSRALAAAADAEHQARGARHAGRFLTGSAPRWGAAALASAALAVLWIGPRAMTPELARERATDSGSAESGTPSSVGAEHQAALMGPEELLDRIIDYHTAPPEPQVTEPRLLPELERAVGVRVPLPSLVQYGAEWQGGSVVRVRRNQAAAYLRYRTRDDHSVTVYVYNPSRIPLHAGLEPRMFREEPVYQGNWRGYSIAAQLRRGVGYAVTTDLDESRSAELVRTISNGANGLH